MLLPAEVGLQIFLGQLLGSQREECLSQLVLMHDVKRVSSRDKIRAGADDKCA